MQYTEIANKILEENQLYKIFGTTFYEVCIIINIFIVPHKTNYMHDLTLVPIVYVMHTHITMNMEVL